MALSLARSVELAVATLLNWNRVDIFFVTEAKSFGRYLGEQHTIRVYRTARTNGPYMLSVDMRDERKRIGLNRKSIESREEHHG